MSVSIDIDNVVKKFGENTVIKGLSLHIRPGSSLPCWGRRGAEKRHCSA